MIGSTIQAPSEKVYPVLGPTPHNAINPRVPSFARTGTDRDSPVGVCIAIGVSVD